MNQMMQNAIEYYEHLLRQGIPAPAAVSHAAHRYGIRTALLDQEIAYPPEPEYEF